MKLEDRFYRRVMPEPMSGCWLWTGTQNGTGYGKLWKDGTNRLAHRIAYEMHRGPIPVGLELDHKCRVRCCVNPAHLEPVTRRENHVRGASEVPAAGALRQRAKTHCPQGHPYEGANLYSRDGRRHCRACRRAAFHRAKSRKKEIG